MIKNILEPKKIKTLQNFLDEGSKAVIVTHLSPDGDALGSSLGLYQLLLNLGLEAQIIVPNSFPSFLNWMPNAENIIIYEDEERKAKEIISKCDLIFCLDFNTISRIGLLAEPIIDSIAKKVMIDHHLEPSDFCDLVISKSEMSSTCELLFRVICALGIFKKISTSVATCIYVGMMTDTGAFTYNSNNPELYDIISWLLKVGIDKDEIYRKVFDNYTINRFKMQGFVLSEKLVVYEEFNTARITLNLEEQIKFKSIKGDTEGFANMPLSIQNIKLAVFFRQDTQNPNMVKLSLRSQGEFPCNEFASKFYGGGGHKSASGAEFYGTLEEAVNILEENLPLYKSYLV